MMSKTRRKTQTPTPQPVVAKPVKKPLPIETPVPPKAAAPRVYMTSFGGSPDGVAAFINIRFLPCWGTSDFAQIVDEIRRTVALGVSEVSLYVDWLMWGNQTGRYVYGGAAAVANLHDLCAFLESRGVLKYVKFWWMPDEPCRNKGHDKNISDADFEQCALDMRMVSAQFPDLKDVGYIVIWGAAYDRRPAKHLMTGQGLDDYDRGAGVLDDYPELERDMQPGQFSVLVPAMYTSEHKPMVIEQFLPYMQTHPRCRMMCVFLYDVAQGGYGYNGVAGQRVMTVANAVKHMNDADYVPPTPPAVPPVPAIPPVIEPPPVPEPWPQAGS